MKNRDRFKNAFQFLSGFHLDWHDEFHEPEEAVAQFIKYADCQKRVDTLRELHQIIAEFHGPELNMALLSISCYYILTEIFMKDKEQFENASQFLSCYFHQDFGFEFEEPEHAVNQFIKGNDDTMRAAVARELHQVVAECDDRDLSDFVFALGCYYSPERHRGIPMRAWLDQVIAEIEHSLSK